MKQAGGFHSIVEQDGGLRFCADEKPPALVKTYV